MNKSESVSGFESHYDLTFEDIKAIATIQFGLVEKRYWLLPFELRWWIANSWPGHSWQADSSKAGTWLTVKLDPAPRIF
jgi:hypothetical protein